MKWIYQFHPKHFFAALEGIDRDSLNAEVAAQPKHRIFFTMLFIAVCLLLVNYVKYSAFFYGMLQQISLWLGESPRYLINELRGDTFSALYSHAWWGFTHLIGYFILPALFIKFYLQGSLKQHGLQWGEVHKHAKWYVFLASPILCFVVMVSFRDDFVNHYPFYDLAYRSWLDLILWELIYITQFIVLEFFFRGFIVNSLRPVFGSNAILVMCLPYLMIHFPKPWLEATGAILFGLFLGVLALQSRSIWGGVGVHVAIATSMDFAALLQSRGLPERFMP